MPEQNYAWNRVQQIVRIPNRATNQAARMKTCLHTYLRTCTNFPATDDANASRITLLLGKEKFRVQFPPPEFLYFCLENEVLFKQIKSRQYTLPHPNCD